MKRQAEISITLKVTFDPDVTNEREVAESLAAVLHGSLDVHQENGCGEVEIGPLHTGAEVQYYDLPARARTGAARNKPANWDEIVVDLRVAVVRAAGEALGYDPNEDGRYDALADQILSIPNDSVWRMFRKLGLDRAPDYNDLPASDMDALVNEVIATYVEIEES